MKSKYAELFTAKLNDMGLVLFEKHRDWDKWALAVNSDRCFMVSNNFEYFLCLPQHKEAVLNSLNGGDSQLSFNGESWTICNCNQPVEWNSDWWYMRPESQSRIKPKKEYVWVAYHKDGFMFDEVGVSGQDVHHRVKEHELSDFNGKDWQYKEIEVEV